MGSKEPGSKVGIHVNKSVLTQLYTALHCPWGLMALIKEERRHALRGWRCVGTRDSRRGESAHPQCFLVSQCFPASCIVHATLCVPPLSS